MVLLTQSASSANLFFQSSSSDVSASSTPASSMSTPNPRPGKKPEYPTLSVKTQLLYHKLKLEDEKDSSPRVERRFNALNNDPWIYPGAVGEHWVACMGCNTWITTDSRHAYYGTLEKPQRRAIQWHSRAELGCTGTLDAVFPRHIRDAEVIYEHERWKLFHDYSDLVDAAVLLCGLKERKAVDETETSVEVF
ncbi:hypothetical protein C8J56DRAFT_900822 [Mycena floridula]|nr:hypothetical protein C8J56DRAFT_900822 [Mycena floridula]